MGNKTVQINFRIKKSQLDELKQLARERSYNENEDISHTDLIRESIKNLIKDSK